MDVAEIDVDPSSLDAPEQKQPEPIVDQMIPKDKEEKESNEQDEEDAETEYNTDEDYGSDANNQPAAEVREHVRGNSFHERHNSLKNEKEALEQKIESLSTTMNIYAGNDAMLEMQRIADDKNLFNKIFDIIDPDDNGDVDVQEWCAGIAKANINVSPEEAQRIFSLMDMDGGGYIERHDWITFCIQHYETEELQKLQFDVLNKIKGHSRKPSNLFRNTDVTEWNASQIDDLEKEMHKELKSQVTEAQQKIEEQEKFYVEIEKKIENDPDFGKHVRAPEWTPQEVALWLDSIEMGQYSRQFADEPIDGEMLLNDCDRNMLINEMQIKPLHVGKIIREIDRLRKLNEKFLAAPYKDWHQLNEENIELEKLNDEYKDRIKDLETENANLKLQSYSIGNMPIPDKTNMGAMFGGDDDQDAQLKIKLLQDELEHLKKMKQELAKNADIEITNLRKIVKVLAVETRSTPYAMNPIDMVMSKLGYTKQ